MAAGDDEQPLDCGNPLTGQVHSDFVPNATGGDWMLMRADYAITLLDVTENPQMSEKAVGLGGAKPVKGGKPQLV